MKILSSFRSGIRHTKNLLFFFVCLLACSVNLQRSAIAQTTTFEKRISETKKLVVSSAETKPEDRMTPARKAIEKLGGIYVKPSKAVEYSLYMIEKGTPDKLLWKEKFPQYSQFGPYSKFKIFDVYLESGNTVVCYLYFNTLSAKIVDSKLPLVTETNDQLWSVMDESLDTGPVIASAVIQGSIKKGDLSLLVKSTNGGSFRFVRQKEKWVPQRTAQIQQVFAQPFALDDQKWQLIYTVDPTATKTIKFDDGRTSTLKGISTTLQKVPISADGKADEKNAVSLNQNFEIPNPSAPPQWWSGDAFVDEETGKAYVVVADGSKFSIQILSLKPLVLSEPLPWLPDTRGQQELDHRDVLVELDKVTLQALPFIDTTSLKRVGQDLIVTLNDGAKTRQQWIYSLEKQSWSRSNAQ